jgi:hypothetical protein
VLPLPKDQQLIETESGTATVAGNGMNAQFGETVHCMAAEPQAVFLRVCVVDRGQEVAYETSCLGRLRVGYRVLNLRSMLGTRIELCHLLVCISFRHEPFSWATARQVSALWSPTLSNCVHSRFPCYALLSCESKTQWRALNSLAVCRLRFARRKGRERRSLWSKNVRDGMG